MATVGTQELVDKKILPFTHWQEDRLDRTRQEECNTLANEVKRAMRRDKGSGGTT